MLKILSFGENWTDRFKSKVLVISTWSFSAVVKCRTRGSGFESGGSIFILRVNRHPRHVLMFDRRYLFLQCSFLMQKLVFCVREEAMFMNSLFCVPQE